MKALDMGTPFITFLEPSQLDGYKRNLPHDQQPAHIPRTFKDAMSVREAVFVRELKLPLEHQHDADDARSCHWVTYASIRMTTQPEVRCPRTNALLKQPRSETKTLPIGTLRIVPFPHPPRPLDGGRYVGGKLQVDDNDKKNDDGSSTVSDASTIEYRSASNTSSSSSSSSRSSRSSSKDSNSTVTTESTIKPSSGSNVSTSSNRSNGHKNGSSGSSNLDATAAGPSQPRRRFSLASHLGLFDPLPFGIDLPTDLHDGKEPYLLLGPLVVLPEFREFPIGALLWNAAKAWLRAHPGYFDPSVTVLGMQTMQAENTQDIPRWNGLVCVHAREAETGIYEGWGFRIDRGMGRFYKEGDLHVGMFQRLEVKSITSWGRLMESHGKHP